MVYIYIYIYIYIAVTPSHGPSFTPLHAHRCIHTVNPNFSGVQTYSDVARCIHTVSFVRSPGVGGGTHRRRATFDRCEVQGGGSLCGCLLWCCSCRVVCCVVLVVCLCVCPVSLHTVAYTTLISIFQACRHTVTWPVASFCIHRCAAILRPAGVTEVGAKQLKSISCVRGAP